MARRRKRAVLTARAPKKRRKAVRKRRGVMRALAGRNLVI